MYCPWSIGTLYHTVASFKRQRGLPRMAAIAAAVALPASIASAHPAISAMALVQIDKQRHVYVRLQHDALALALDQSPQRSGDAAMFNLLNGPDDALDRAFLAARRNFSDRFEIAADDRRLTLAIDEFSTAAAVRKWQRDNPDRSLPIQLDIVGRTEFAAGTRVLTVRFPEVIGEVILTIDRPETASFTMPVRAGEITRIELEGATSHQDRGAGSGVSSAPAGALEVAIRYLEMGFTHIVPRGLDHVLFVLGLFFLSPSLRALLWQITAFTLAHSISLALSMLGVVELSPRIVEPIIAASIMFVAIENVATDKVHAWRPLVVFVFGLIHGMGFAGALREVGLPRGQLASALVSFNVGVELGQLTVIACAFAAVGWWRQRPWYRRAITVPASIAIAAIGTVWTVQRLM